MGNYLKLLWNAFKACKNNKEDINVKKKFDSKVIHGFSLYGKKKESDSAKAHHWIHFVFKYKIMMPIFYALEKSFKKHMYTPTDKWYDDIYNLWDKSVEEASYEWTKQYLGINKNWTEEQIKEKSKNTVFMKMYRIGQHGIIGNDSAYRELQNILTYKLVNNFIEKYKDKKEINHLMYTSPNIYDVNYYYAGHDLLNRYFIKSDNEEKLLFTDTLPVGHKKAYFTLDVTKGWDYIFEQMRENLRKMPSNMMVTGFKVSSTGINNMEIEVFDKNQQGGTVKHNYEGR